MAKLRAVLTSDTSGSMKGKKIRNSKQAQKDFIDKLAGDSLVGLVSFGGKVNLTHELTGNLTELKKALAGTSANGGTPMYKALQLSYDLLAGRDTGFKIQDLFGPSNNKKTNPPPKGQKRVLVLSSDGKANGGGSKREILQLGRQIRDKGIRIITIAIGSSADISLLKKLASSEEDFHIAQFSGELPDLYEEVAAGLIVAE
ncbi:VWA domain-containing protein [Candidatus Bipolaricaulota bacterium]|nr:VWA domain-containing protein [Candidatus Bipolaricaulota bacterium]